MIEKGANPFVVNAETVDQFGYWSLAKSNLSNLPTQKSVYFTIRPRDGEIQDEDSFLDPWFYRTGVFGKFDSLIGRGASGVVISGDWFGKRAAFKFVEVGIQKKPDTNDVRDSLKLLNDTLSEMTSIQDTSGTKIVKFLGHYR